MNATRRVALRRLVSSTLTLPFFPALVELCFAQETPAKPKRDENQLGPSFGPRQPFSHALLITRAKALASEPYRAPQERHSGLLDRIGYDAHNQIRLRREHALRRSANSTAVDFFHLSNLFRRPVAMHAVEGDTAREMLYDRAHFAFGKEVWFAEDIPDGLGFAGFRLREKETWEEWLSFLGAAYFRSPGESGQFGLSARAIAVNTGLAQAEEFPDFTDFWFEHVGDQSQALIIHALLDGPSVTGAYRIKAWRETGVLMDVDATLFLRADVKRLGLAPLTSMFWYGKHDRHRVRAWRPQVHDSDGLALWTGAGEHIWRPLNNPPHLQISTFVDVNPQGFGLLQRDRQFESYEDTQARYDKRPSLWVEPLEQWGPGSVQLVELPTGGEYNDNIVAFWRSDAPARSGTENHLRYRLHWRDDEPYPSPLGRVTATRVGKDQVSHPRFRTIAVDFAGGMLRSLPDSPEMNRGEVEFALSAERGEIARAHTLPIDGGGRWRGIFEFAAPSKDPVDIRGFLRLGEETLTETWTLQFIPFE